MEPLERRDLLATLTWVGDLDLNWNSGTSGVDTNWDNNTLPADGDTLIFPQATSGATTNNDTTAGNSYILEVGQGNNLQGNSITLDLVGVDVLRPTPPVDGGSEALIQNPLTLVNDTEFNVSSGGNSQLWLTGVLSGATGGLTNWTAPLF